MRGEDTQNKTNLTGFACPVLFLSLYFRRADVPTSLTFHHDAGSEERGILGNTTGRRDGEVARRDEPEGRMVCGEREESTIEWLGDILHRK